MKIYIKSSRDTNSEFNAGWDKAMTLSKGDTYMYDSSRRIYELSLKDPDYATATNAYRSGFAQAVY